MELSLNSNPPQIMHVDLNSCFATACQQAYRTLRDKILVVAAYETSRAVILAPSINAKRIGIKVGMRVFEAQKLYSPIIVRQPDIGLIRDIHTKFLNICKDYSSDVVPLSIDEVVIDFSTMGKVKKEDLTKIAYEIKVKLKEDVGDFIKCNIGIATNRFLAKVASELNKPDGLDVITHENILDIYRKIQLLDLPGINVRYKARLNTNNIFTPIDFYKASFLMLKRNVFASIIGYYWYMRLHGWEVDNGHMKRKTYSQQYTLVKKTNDLRKLSRLLLKLCEKMGRRLRKKGYVAHGIHVGCAQEDGRYWHKCHKTVEAIYTTRDLYKEARHLLNKRPKNPAVKRLSVCCYGIKELVGSQVVFFDMDTKQHKIASASDSINDKYGEFTITPARMMDMSNIIVDHISFGRTKTK